MEKIVVIGGGPAGMIASGFASKNGTNNVILLEKNSKLGRKLFITGKGRCNVTNNCSPEELIENTAGNPYFMYSAYYMFDSSKTIDFFNELGVKTKVERGNRVFPLSDKSSHIVEALENFMNINKVDVRLNCKVNNLIVENGKIIKVVVDKKEISVDKVIIATGGLSYPVTGSDGEGYSFAKDMGHKITKLYPSLVPLKAKENWCKDLQGLSLKNVTIKLSVDGKEVYSNFGEMLFTHFGITGPIVLKGSRSLVGQHNKKIKACIDLKPALTEKELDLRLLRDFEKYKNKEIKNGLCELLPQKIIPVIINLSKISENKKINEITKLERLKIVNIIKNLSLTITGDNGYNEAIITSGGICVDNIDPSTMQSKLINNLAFAGEIIDVDCYTGGFNLQVAFSTGYLAGTNI